MQNERQAAPAAWRAKRGGKSGTPGNASARRDFMPIALAVQKRGRPCVVAKVTHFEGEHEPILAVAWRAQKGTTTAISMPVAALDYARQVGVTRFYLRNDRTMAMWSCPLEMFQRGRLGNDGERYVFLAWLQPVVWREWAYAHEIVELEAGPPAQQLGLWEAT